MFNHGIPLNIKPLYLDSKWFFSVSRVVLSGCSRLNHFWCIVDYSFNFNNDPSDMRLILPTYVSALVGNAVFVDLQQTQKTWILFRKSKLASIYGFKLDLSLLSEKCCQTKYVYFSRYKKTN